MDYEGAKNLIYNIGRKASNLLYNNFIVCTPLYKEHSVLPYIVQKATIQLMSSCHTSSESALILIGNNRLWDTEPLIRSIVEGTVKYIYIYDGTLEQRIQKAEEYLNIIPEIERIRMHYKANEFLKKVDDKSKKWYPVKETLLSSNELSLLMQKYPKEYKEKLRRRWSFTEIVSHISKNIEFDTIVSLHFGYSYGSHLIHQDGDGIQFKQDRIKRNIEGDYLIDVAHAATQISNLLELSVIRSSLYCKMQLLDPSILKQSILLIDKFKGELEKYYKYWFDENMN